MSKIPAMKAPGSDKLRQLGIRARIDARDGQGRENNGINPGRKVSPCKGVLYKSSNHYCRHGFGSHE